MVDWGYLTPETVSEFITFNRACKKWTYQFQSCHDCDECVPGINNSKNMYDKQAEGTAYIWNLLHEKGLAILADEVGMGKTMQALAVASLLWRIKPQARILVFAPREEVARNWMTEYHTFINSHYKQSDDLVRTSIGNKPIYDSVYCENLFDIVEKVNKGCWYFYVAKTTSFSYAMQQYNGKCEKSYRGLLETKSRRVCKKDDPEALTWLGGELRTAIVKSNKFDLLIIDEAHYYRNFSGGSLRVNVAKGFLKNISDKVLLMTATPNHNSIKNVKGMVEYFDNIHVKNIKNDDASKGDKEEISKRILNEFTVRRLRVLENKNKYQYRKEISAVAKFEDINNQFSNINSKLDESIRSELFYALYQKKLVKDQNLKKENYRILFGYLEGFESIPNLDLPDEIDGIIYNVLTSDLQGYYILKNSDKSEIYIKNKERNAEEYELKIKFWKCFLKKFKDIDEASMQSKYLVDDFFKAKDTHALTELALEYYGIYKKHPNHPKYDKLINSIVPPELDVKYWQQGNDKSLIFVRRIPSVYEISRRVLEVYDQMLWIKIQKAWETLDKDEYGNLPEHPMSRRNYQKRFRKKIDSSKQEDKEGGEGEEISSNIPKSSVLDLFTVKKKEKGKRNIVSTHASLFRLRFNRKTDRFSVFFQPSSDYQDGIYPNITILKEGGKNDYLSSIADMRLKKSDSCSSSIRNILFSLDKIIYDGSEERSNEDVKTFWSIFWNYIEDEERRIINNLNLYEKESLARYLQKGLTLGSSSIVELYSWFILSSHADDGKDLYEEFIRVVEKNLSNSLTLSILKKAVQHFSIFKEKIIGIYDDIELLENDKKIWNVFNNLEPVYPYSGGTKNKSIISAFNSPFYPDILVSTSVLQEGVNLQYFCRNVFHYGITWTPGDNEQRIGRIDRMFGLIEKNLKKNDGNSTLDIYYPYLSKTLDENQVGSFIKRKFLEENNLDRCLQRESDTVIPKDDVDSVDWREFLRKPDENFSNENFQEPYEPNPKFNDKVLKTNPYPKTIVNSKNVMNHKTVVSVLHDIFECILKEKNGTDFTINTLFDEHNIENSTNTLFIISPKLKPDYTKNQKRNQPVLVELNYQSKISGLFKNKNSGSRKESTNKTVYYLSLKTPLSKYDEKKIELINTEYNRLKESYKLVKVAINNDANKNSYFHVYMKVDLPVFMGTEKSYISKEEVQIAFNQLIEFCDKIEYNVFKDERQDVSIEDIRHELPALVEISKNSSDLKISKRVLNDFEKRGWEVKKGVIKKEKLVLSRNLSNGIEEKWSLNHRYPFVNFFQKKNNSDRIYLETVYPSMHVQKEEIHLLEKWFNHVSNKYCV